MTDEEATTKITLGEVYRSNERLAGFIAQLTQELRDQHREMATSVSAISVQQATLVERVDDNESTMRELKEKVDGLVWKAAMFTGAGGVIVFIAEMIWKH